MANIFCKVAGIPGETSDDKHKDYFEVLSYQHGVSQNSAGDTSSLGGHVAGRATHDPFTVVKYLDKSSPTLAQFCSSGKSVDSVVVEVWRHLGDHVKSMEYKMTDVVIKSIYPSGEGEKVSTETVSFAYSKITWTHSQYNNQGKHQGDTKGGWDTTKNSVAS
jgi:type VI secretion system secreted protein Hcp